MAAKVQDKLKDCCRQASSRVRGTRPEKITNSRFITRKSCRGQSSNNSHPPVDEARNIGNRAGWWCQVGQGGGSLLLVAQMGQNTADNLLVLNGGDVRYRITAITAIAADLNAEVQKSVLEITALGKAND